MAGGCSRREMEKRTGTRSSGVVETLEKEPPCASPRYFAACSASAACSSATSASASRRCSSMFALPGSAPAAAAAGGRPQATTAPLSLAAGLHHLQMSLDRWRSYLVRPIVGHRTVHFDQLPANDVNHPRTLDGRHVVTHDVVDAIAFDGDVTIFRHLHPLVAAHGPAQVVLDTCLEVSLGA